MRTRRVSKAFTLVEILIVVVILGILAAIVVPQFTNATDDARNGNAVSQVKTLENQFELFRARTGAYPTIGDCWGNLILGGYVKAPPVNPYTGLSDASDVPGSGAWSIYMGDPDGDGLDQLVIEANGAP